MIVYGYPKVALDGDLAIAVRLGAEVLEILPDWRAFPDPRPLRSRADELGLTIHSAHGCWGGQSIRAQRVDLGNPDPRTWAEGVDDLKRCADWLKDAGGRFLVIHPGGLSEPVDSARRRDALIRGLNCLTDHSGGAVTLCVENMPPGVYPGSRMSDLRSIVDEVARLEVALALDTGHAAISSTPRAETLAAGPRLATTHVHDNDGRQDSHRPPGEGIIDWAVWVEALDAIEYRGPILLECIKHLRDRPESLSRGLIGRLRRICGIERS